MASFQEQVQKRQYIEWEIRRIQSTELVQVYEMVTGKRPIDGPAGQYVMNLQKMVMETSGGGLGFGCGLQYLMEREMIKRFVVIHAPLVAEK